MFLVIRLKTNLKKIKKLDIPKISKKIPHCSCQEKKREKKTHDFNWEVYSLPLFVSITVTSFCHLKKSDLPITNFPAISHPVLKPSVREKVATKGK